MEDVLVSIPEACKALSIKRSTLYRMMKNREIKYVKLGKRTLIPTASIRAIAEGTVDA